MIFEIQPKTRKNNFLLKMWWNKFKNLKTILSNKNDKLSAFSSSISKGRIS